MKMFAKIKGMSKKKKKLCLIILAGVVLVFAACYTVFIAPLLKRDRVIYKEAVAEKGTITAGIMESGSLEFGTVSQMYNLTIPEDDEDEDEDDSDDEETISKYLEVEEVYVAVGECISEGDNIIKFTEDSVSDVRKRLKAFATECEIAYAEAQSEYNLEEINAELTKEATTAVVDYAESIYNNMVGSVNDSLKSKQVQITELEGKRESLQEALETAQENYDEVYEAYETAALTLEQIGTGNELVYIPYYNAYLNAKSRYESVKNQLEQAQNNITKNEEEIVKLQSEIVAAAQKKDIDILEAKQTYESAQMDGTNAEIEYSATLANLKADLEDAKAEMDEAEELLADFEALVGDSGIVCASGDGIITELGFEAGDILESAGVVVTYATWDGMTISVDVSQEDVVDLKVGDSVNVDFTAYEGETYKGVIESITTTATSRNTSTISYPVKISVTGDTSALYAGMTADVTFVTDTREDVIYISRNAIVEENGKTYVYVSDGFGKKDLKQVTTGLSDGVNIEIVEGLSEGETYYIASRVSSTSSLNDSSEATNNDNVDNGLGNMEVPGEMGMPDNFEMPEGMEFPSGMQMPGNMDQGGGMARPNMGR